MRTDLIIVWKDTRLWSKYTKSHSQDIKEVLKYCSEYILFISQVNQIETARSLEMARKTLYLVKFCLEIDHAWQVTCNLTF